MIRIVSLAVAASVVSTVASAGIVSDAGSALGAGVGNATDERRICIQSLGPDGLVDSCSPTSAVEIGELSPLLNQITGGGDRRVPIACTGWYGPDGAQNCIYGDAVEAPTCAVSLGPNGLVDTCSLTPSDIEVGDLSPFWDAIVSGGEDSRVPIACTAWYGPDGARNCTYGEFEDPALPQEGVSNQVPAPGGLLLILAGLGFALRKKISSL